MKIALVSPTFRIKGGVETTTLSLMEALMERGHGVKLFTSEISLQEFPAHLREATHELHAGGLFSTFLDWRRAGWKLRSLLEAFDCIHCQNHPTNVWLYYCFKKARNHPPVLLFLHEPPAHLYGDMALKPSYGKKPRYFKGRIREEGWNVLPAMMQKSVFYSLRYLCPERLDRFHREIDGRAVHAADLLLTTSRYIQEKLKGIFGLSFEVCDQGIKVPAVIHAAPDPDGKEYLLTVGRLEPQKNTEMILQAMKILSDRGACLKVKLKIVGSGTEAVRLQQLCGELSLEDRVEFLGFVSRDMLWQLYAGAMAVITLPFNEPLGLVPIEAMLAGTPVIVAEEGGMKETVLHEDTGLSVDPRNPGKVAEAIERLYRDRDFRRTLAGAGRKHASARFSWDGFVTRMETYYSKLAELRHEGRH